MYLLTLSRQDMTPQITGSIKRLHSKLRNSNLFNVTPSLLYHKTLGNKCFQFEISLFVCHISLPYISRVFDIDARMAPTT